MSSCKNSTYHLQSLSRKSLVTTLAIPSGKQAVSALLVAAVLGLAGDFSAKTLVAVDKGKAKANPKMKTGGTVSRWGVKPDPPAEMLKWPDKLKLSISQPQRSEELLFPLSPSEFCLVNLQPYESNAAELWNLATGERVGIIKGNPVQSNKRALSPDGKYLALLPLDQKKSQEVEVWSLETGKQLSSFTPDDPPIPMTILDFAGPGEVLTYTFGQPDKQNGKFVQHLRVWDAETGKSVRQMDLDKNISGDTHYDISPGRKWLATGTSDVVLYDLGTGQAKATIHPPTKTEDGKFAHLDSFRFSADGSEIVCMSDGGQGTVIVVYDMATGEPKLKHEIPAAYKSNLQHPASYKGPHIEFVSVPAGFLWHGGAFIERESGLMIWTYKQGILEHSHWNRFLTPAGLIVSTGGNNARQIQVLPFPAEKLKKSVEVYRNDGAAIVKPGEKVKLTVKVSEVRFGKPEEAKQALETVIAERLADDGLEVSDEGSTTIAVQYKEKAGKVLQEATGGDRLGRGAVLTGRSIQSTAGELQISWTSKDGKTKIYEQTVNLDPTQLTITDPGEITAEKAREQVFRILKSQLSGLPMPYFFPEDKSLAALPMTTTSEMAVKLSPQDAMKKKIEAKKKKIGK